MRGYDPHDRQQLARRLEMDKKAKTPKKPKQNKPKGTGDAGKK
ncbi:MAG TPA: hypothetical protein VIM30_18405 [Candidatus Limnocylindrales bacterium]